MPKFKYSTYRKVILIYNILLLSFIQIVTVKRVNVFIKTATEEKYFLWLYINLTISIDVKNTKCFNKKIIFSSTCCVLHTYF